MIYLICYQCKTRPLYILSSTTMPYTSHTPRIVGYPKCAQSYREDSIIGKERYTQLQRAFKTTLKRERTSFQTIWNVGVYRERSQTSQRHENKEIRIKIITIDHITQNRPMFCRIYTLGILLSRAPALLHPLRGEVIHGRSIPLIFHITIYQRDACIVYNMWLDLSGLRQWWVARGKDATWLVPPGPHRGGQGVRVLGVPWAFSCSSRFVRELTLSTTSYPPLLLSRGVGLFPCLWRLKRLLILPLVLLPTAIAVVAITCCYRCYCFWRWCWSY